MYFLLNPGVSIWTSNTRMLTVSPMFYIQLPHRFLIVWTRSQSHLENINSDETNRLPNTYMQQTSIKMYRIDAGPLSLFVCLFVSLLSHFWLIHFFHLRLLYQPYLGICQAPCVQSQQRQPMSAVAITACEVQVSAADSQTVPTVVTGVSKPLCCRSTLTFTLTRENLSLCTTL